MIVDHLSQLQFYGDLVSSAQLQQIAKFLADNSVSSLPPGIQEIDGKQLFVNIIEGSGKSKAGAVLERHNHYLDVHVTLQGEDLIGWKARQDCISSQGYDLKNEVELYQDKPDIWVAVPTGSFMIVFPQDAHAPMAFEPNLTVKKAVFKVRLGGKSEITH